MLTCQLWGGYSSVCHVAFMLVEQGIKYFVIKLMHTASLASSSTLCTLPMLKTHTGVPTYLTN